MKAILISRTQRQLEELRHAVEAGPWGVAAAVLRKASQPLLPLLAAQGADLVVVDGGPSAQEDLEALAPFTAAHPDVAVVVLSGNRDSDTLLAAMHAGVREVLPSPATAAELSAALGRLARRQGAPRPAAPPGRVIAFVSCKGGSGATFVATNVAYLLGAEHAKPTALVDLDLQYGDASYFVTDAPGKSSIADLARQSDRLDARLLAACMTHVAPNFDVLAAPDDPEQSLAVTAVQVERILDLVVQKYAFVILDVDRVLDTLSIKALDRAERVYLVMENMVPFVRDARRLLGILRSLGYPDSKLRLVVNRFRKSSGIEIARLEKAVGLPVAHVLQESFDDVSEAVNAGVALTTLHPHNTVARGLRAVADGIAGGHGPVPSGWVSRLVGAHD
jgi:pilus assembly protein CpaE